MQLSITVHQKRNAYSLWEVMITLTIIGLITIAVISARSTIVKARVINILHKIKDLEKSYNLFFVLYTAVPGDFHNATKQFTLQNFNDRCLYFDNKGFNNFTFGVNGNGNGIIDTKDIAAIANETDAHFEQSATFCHLALANLLPSSYKDKPIVYENMQVFSASGNKINGLEVLRNNRIFIGGPDNSLVNYAKKNEMQIIFI